MRARSGLVAMAAALVLVGCGDTGKLDPLAERGRQVYMSQCTQCHAVDPAEAGAVGPPVKGASRALLEARIVRGDYPPGYTPKRSTKVMPPMPTLAPELESLTAYLR